MKRLQKLALGSGLLLLAVAGVGLQQGVVENSTTVVSDQQASLLYGGQCEAGTTFGLIDWCNGSDIDCFFMAGYVDTGGNGPQKARRFFCGVKECGGVTRKVSCGDDD